MHAIKTAVLKKLFQIRTERKEQGAKPVLGIRLGEKHISFAITDGETGELSSLYYYTTEQVNETRLSGLAAAHSELNRPFYKVCICYDYTDQVMLPAGVFSEIQAGDMLKMFTGSGEQPALLSETFWENGLQNAYGVPPEVHAWLTNKFPDARHRHLFSLMVQQPFPAERGEVLRMDIDRDQFALVAVKADRLLFAGTFQYATPEDVLYYLLKTCEEYDCSPLTARLLVSGLVERDSSLYREIYQYFMHPEFREASWKPVPGDHPSHFFTILGELTVCES